MVDIINQQLEQARGGFPANFPRGSIPPAAISALGGQDSYVLALVNGISTWVEASTIIATVGTVPVVSGGTGMTSYTRGDIITALGPTELGVITAPGGSKALFSDFVLEPADFRRITVTDIDNGQILSKVDDTNITLTLGGTPTKALLKAVSLTLGWTGTLAVGRGGTGLSTLIASGRILYSTSASALTTLAFNSTATNKYLQSVSSGNPSWQQVAFTDLSGSLTYAQLPTGSGTWDPGLSSMIIRLASHLRLDSHLGIQAAPSNLRGIDAEVALSGTAGSVESGMLLASTFTDTQGVPAAGYGWQVTNSTSASVFVLPDMRGIMINTPTIGAGSSVTIGYGIYIASQTGAGTNYAIYTNLGTVRFGDAVIGPSFDSGAASDLLLKYNGTTKITISTSSVTFVDKILAYVGTQTIPGYSFAGFTTTGISYTDVSGLIHIIFAGADTFSFSNTGIFTADKVVAKETSGPTALTLFGSLADGQYLKRSGTSIVGDTITVGTIDAYPASLGYAGI